MNASKDYLKQNEIMPRISFKEKPRRVLTLLEDKLDTITDDDGKKIEGVKYLVEENGEKKTFFTGSVGLIQKLSEFEKGTEVVIELKSKKGEKGWISFFEAKKFDSAHTVEDELPPPHEEQPY